MSAAFDSDDKPTKAALGFARSCGIELDQLQRLETDKGTWLVHRTTEAGLSLDALAPQLVEQALKRLPIPKRMRWSDLSTEFVRPVHWVVLLLDAEVVDAEILGLRAGRKTRGHRFHCPEPLTLEHAHDYEDLLREPGHVLASFDARRETIRAQVEALADEAGYQVRIEPALLDEVTALVEWPVALVGSFDEAFLRVPREALISTMQGNQKYFPLFDGQGALAPAFIAVANLDSREPERVRAGNERVIRPRMADAAFFWDQDRQRPLADRHAELAGVVFQRQLGTLLDKSNRVSALADTIAALSAQQLEHLSRAAELSRCDLLTAMVEEFPELQGVMGRHYAQHDGEPEAVCIALEEQYWPRFAGDRLPGSPDGQLLALAERLDTLAGIFAIGQKPTGVKDPFALRRTALAIVRILIECELALDLLALLQAAVAAQPVAAGTELVDELFDFLVERLRAYYLADGITAQQFDAVLARRPTGALDFHRRLQAVSAFTKLPGSESLAAANKRIRNILRPLPERDREFDVQRCSEAAERALFDALVEIEEQAQPLLQGNDYVAALNVMAGLRAAVDDFFDQVLVMADDEAVRENRVALLQRVAGLFLQVADISLLPGGES